MWVLGMEVPSEVRYRSPRTLGWSSKITMYSCVNKHLERQLVLASRYRPLITPTPFWCHFCPVLFSFKNFVPVTTVAPEVRVSSMVRVRVRAV